MRLLKKSLSRPLCLPLSVAFAVALTLMLALTLTSCTTSAPPAGGQGAAGDTASAAGEQGTTAPAGDTTTQPASEPSGNNHNDTLRLSVTTTYSGIDPHYVAQNADFILCSLLYDSFYEVDDRMNLDPRLATGYDVSDDGLTYTYHLKSGVKWQTGEDFTAADAVYSIRRAQESPYMAAYVGPIADVSAPDDTTVVITLSALSPTFFADINRVRFLGEAATKDFETGFAAGIPGGTGPYTIASWQPDQKVVLKRNAAFHGAPAPIGTIELTVFGDTNAATRAFEAGELDYVSVLSSDYTRLGETGKYKTYTEETASVVFIAMNNQVSPFDNPLVRQAVGYAVDKNSMLYAAADGFGRTVSSLGNPVLMFGAPDAGEIFEYQQDIERAKQLIIDAGYPGGLTLTEPILTMATDEFSIPAQVLQAQLAEIGVTVEVQTSEQSALVSNLILGNYTLASMALTLDTDASALAMAYTTGGIDALNMARYSNPRVDELFELAAQTLDQSARKAYFTEAFDIASKDAAYMPLYSINVLTATDKDLDSSIYTTYYYWSWN
ncbi:MAG: ABC transporter substrate-binding protein [Clostridiales bacterium]|nr:ABC transporter substrate-binding protein [Clostridiales bacterium]